MTPLQFLETAASLSVQSLVLVGLTAWRGRKLAGDRDRDRLWAACQAALLLLVLADLTLPHLRIIAPRVAGAPGFEALARFETRLAIALAAAWAVGAGVSTFGLARGWMRALHILREAHSADLTRLPRVEGAERFELLTSRAACGPFCWQIHRPLIILPESIYAFPAEEIALILRHEVAHLRAGHPLQLFVQRLVEIVFWFHPAIWWSSRQAAQYREFVCDSAAVSSRHEVATYLKAILRLVERDRPLEIMPAALGCGGRGGLLQRRAERLAALRDPTSTDPRALRSTRLPFVAAAALMLTFWLPLDADALDRSLWSPWPAWSARLLQDCGLPVRDYEIDGHRRERHRHRAADRAR
jgi:beta-lactamase regulating signal transducer with metallopeptidase domain